jgi:hypothetical protein
MSDAARRWDNLPPEKKSYVLRELCTHLAAAKQHERLVTLLTEEFFLKAKLDVLGARAILYDLTLARESVPADHPMLEKLRPLEEAIDDGIRIAINRFLENRRTVNTIKIFYSYCHVDEEWRNLLEKHLSVLRHQNIIQDWHDRKIIPGAEWEKQISANLNSAQVVLLLMSSDFLASKYCWNIEVKRAIERHNSGEARVIPVIIRPCDWKNTPIGKLLALPTDGKAVTLWTHQDDAFMDIAAGIRRAVEDLTSSL